MSTRRQNGANGVRAALGLAGVFAVAIPASAQDMPSATMPGGQPGMMNDHSMMPMMQTTADTYIRRFVHYNLEAASRKRYMALGNDEKTIKGAANIALRSGLSMDYVLSRVNITGLPLAQVAVMLGVPANVVDADIPGMGGAMMMGGMGGAMTPPMNADLRLDLAQPVTNTAGPQTPPPDDLRTITPEEKAAADQGAQDSLRRADPQMRAVLEALQGLNAPPLFTLTPEQARRQPSIADAVKAVLTQRGQSTAPEPVASVRDMTIPGPAGPVPVRVYTPAGNGPFPAVVYFHGGGFVIATIDTYDSSCRALANAAQAVVVSVEYRKAPENKLPAAHEDSYAALQYVMNNGGEFGVDGNRVAVAGESAGGNLAADMCLLARARNGKMPVHQLLVYPVADGNTDRPSDRENENAIPLGVGGLKWFFFYAVPNNQFGQSPLVNLAGAAPVARDLPPATIVLAEIDPLRSEGEVLAQRLRSGGVNVRFRNYPGVTHEFFGTGAVVDKAKQAVQFAAEGLKSAFNK